VEALVLKLFGGFELSRKSGEILVITARKSAALVAYLALQRGQPQSRDRLASLLWESSPDDRARASLRQALLGLRQLVPQMELLVEPRPEHLALNPRVEVDVLAFEAALSSMPPHLPRAAGLFHGDLLEGLRIDSDGFETWLMGERLRLRSAALATMHTLLEAPTAHRVDEHIQIALRALALDPAEETAHRSLIRLYAESGRRSEALRQYYRCRDTLWREFSVRPEPATDLLYKSVLGRAAQRPA
jgi:DNA-binding SARP family transcriptional activator